MDKHEYKEKLLLEIKALNVKIEETRESIISVIVIMKHLEGKITDICEEANFLNEQGIEKGYTSLHGDIGIGDYLLELKAESVSITKELELLMEGYNNLVQLRNEYEYALEAKQRVLKEYYGEPKLPLM